MTYKEIQPPAFFSHHIECYWEMLFQPGELDDVAELLMPNCTFNIIFTNEALTVNFQANGAKVTIKRGATFMGQRSNCIRFSSKKPVRILGIRFKPHAFATIIKTPVYLLNDQFLALDKLFNLNGNSEKQIKGIITCQEEEKKVQLVNDFLLVLFKDWFSIDQTLRAQLNYILTRKGMIKVQDLFSEFGISKVTLRKHFVNKVGLVVGY